MNRRLIALLALAAASGGASGQPDPTAGNATVGDLPPAIIKTLEALGASSGFPDALWEFLAGVDYVQQVAEGQSWGICLSAGSASDRPFHTIHEMAVNGLAFWRSQTESNNAWLVYVVSTTN